MLFTFAFEGNLAADPELSFTPTGKARARLRVGHNTRRRTPAGEWVNGPTLWITVTAWEDLAERLVESLRVGDTVLVEARNDLSVWAYLNQQTDKPAGQLQVTAANVSLSLRFNPAASRRKPRRPAMADTPTAAAPVEDDPWATSTDPFTGARADHESELDDDQDLYERDLDGQDLEPTF